MTPPDPAAERRARDTAALLAFHGADLRPGTFFALERAGAIARVHEADLTAAERAALRLPALVEPAPATTAPEDA